MTQPIPGNNTAKASSSELQTLRFKFLFNSTALSLLLLCSTVCCCCSCANDTRLEGLDSSKCSLCISKAKKYKAALTTESTQAIWHSGFSVSSLLQGSWHLPGHQPPEREPDLIPVPSGMQPPDHQNSLHSALGEWDCQSKGWGYRDGCGQLWSRALCWKGWRWGWQKCSHQ